MLIAWAGVFVLGGCEKKPQPQESQPQKSVSPSNRESALLLAQAQFVEKDRPGGESIFVPGPAKLTVVYPDDGRWTHEVIEDPDGNVFHKAMPFDLPGEQPGILTISANKAPLPGVLKIWHRTADGWKGTALWKAKFDGKWNRFRDVEIGDVTGDGKPDIVVATHDQGVVAVLQKTGDTWEATQIDQAPDIFVHEIEIGDVDGDGLNEIFATPSAPNKVDGTPQPGWIVIYRYEDGKFSRHVVEEFTERHVKEILLADVMGSGRPDLYAVLEVQLGQEADPFGYGESQDLEIRQYRFTEANPAGSMIATLPDKQCRFLNVGDVDGDGKAELIASAYKSGIWMIKPGGDRWVTELIDYDSSGYEHATALADMDGDGTLEIYAASDDQHQLRRYKWTGEKFQRTDLFKLTDRDITFGLMPCLDAKCLAAQ